jgi:hypothetical protein
MNNDITAIYNETFWTIHQIFDSKYSYNYVLVKMFHYNSLTDTNFLESRDPYDQIKAIHIHIPENIIQNNKSKLLLDNLDYIIKNKIPFIEMKTIDNTDTWIVNEKIIEDNLKHDNKIL